MTADYRIYQNLPGNPKLTACVDAWRCWSGFAHTTKTLGVRVNRAFLATETVWLYSVANARMHVEEGSVKMGQPIERPIWTVQRGTRSTGMTALTGRLTWNVSISLANEPIYEDFIIGWTAPGSTFKFYISPILHLSQLRFYDAVAPTKDGYP